MRSEHFLATDEDQLFIRQQTEDFIRCQQLSAAEGVRPAELRGVVADVHGIEFPHLTLHLHGGYANTVTEVFRRKHIGTAEEYRGVACAQDLLPLIVRVAVFHLTDVLEKHSDRDAARADRADFLCKIRDQAAVGELIQDELHLRLEDAAFAVAVGVADELNEQEAEDTEASEESEDTKKKFFKKKSLINLVK